MKRIVEIKLDSAFRLSEISHVYVKGDYIDGHYLCFQYHHPRNTSLAKLIKPDTSIIPVIDENGIFVNAPTLQC